MRHLSVFGAFAVAFGCSVGWDAFAMPWSTFLPKAGPLGTLLGLLAGGLVMAVIAWNFHYMIGRRLGPGGVYSYARDAFGHDHGYLCAWFLCFTYAAIVWADATALPMIVRYFIGDVFRDFGFRYSLAGFEVCAFDMLIVVVFFCAVAAVCVRRTLAALMQTILAVCFLTGLAACFASTAVHGAGEASLRPFFAPDGGNAFLQFAAVFTISPWLFVGFESISTMSLEFRFPRRKSFGVMLAAIAASLAAYALLMLIPVFASSGSAGGWVSAVASAGDVNASAFDFAKGALGAAGPAVLCIALTGALFTNLVGNTLVASRLIAAMADDGALPAWLNRRGGVISARNATFVVVALAVATSALGQTVIGVVLDVGLVGAAVAYAYTSAAVLKAARAEGDRLSSATGLAGLVISVLIGLLYLMPTFSAEVATMGTLSYLVVVLWCVAGLVFFLLAFRRDTLRRFGHSPVVWISLFAMIIGLSFTWFRQTASESLEETYNAIVVHHSGKCLKAGSGHAVEDEWNKSLKRNLSIVRRTIVRNTYVQGGLCLLAIAIMLAFYGILRRREREMEQEKARAKSYFFSTVSHDIRTPLNAIIGFSEMLKAGFKTEAERDQAVDAILVSGKTLLGLINDVLDLSKLESGKMDISPEPTDCASLMNGVTEAFRVSSTKSGVELRCRVGEIPPLMLDPQRIRQIVFNLIGNAVKFTTRGHVELRASFCRANPSSDAGTFRIEVEDTGCGIGEEDLRRIGSAYVQVGSKISRNGGTGLGLAICKQLAAAMGGALDVDSALGRGSTFTVVIPNVKVAPASATADLPRVSAKGAAGQSGDLSPSGRVHRLLVVDDSKMNVMVLKALLKHVGDFDVTTASDGQEALEVLEAPDAKPFDLVLTDMWMPRMDGVGLVKAIRANPAHSSMRVIVVTADVEYQGKYEEMGFDGMLLKPITTDRLVKTLEEACK